MPGRIVRGGIFLGVAAACLSGRVSPPLALALGAVFAMAMQNPFGATAHQISKWLLQACVVMVGFGMNLPVVLRAGANGALFAACTITLTLLLGYALGKLLKTNLRTSTLISAGTAICGGSAIAAVGSAMDADEGDMTVAMGVVFVLNGVALYLFPILGHALHLSDRQFGTWAGVAIHDVSSVVGAASRFGADALQTATAVKLSRALWIVPLTLAIAATQTRRPTLTNATFGFDAPAPTTPRKVQIPWFIGLFLMASLCRSFVPGVAAAAPMLSRAAMAGLTLTLFLIGSGLSLATLKSVGWRAMAQGAGLWAFISIFSLVVILMCVPR